jgi:hypothetical protein
VLTFDNKVQIFYERVTGWQLDIADQVINGVKTNGGPKVQIVGAGFAALNIVVSYFEMIAKYKEGYCNTNKSKEYFTKGLEMVFPDLCKTNVWLPDKMYYSIRCGLYHHGLTEQGIILKGEGLPPITPLEKESLIVNPHTLVTELKMHFEQFIKQLKDNGLKANFEKRFDFDNS